MDVLVRRPSSLELERWLLCLLIRLFNFVEMNHVFIIYDSLVAIVQIYLYCFRHVCLSNLVAHLMIGDWGQHLPFQLLELESLVPWCRKPMVGLTFVLGLKKALLIY